MDSDFLEKILILSCSVINICAYYLDLFINCIDE